MLKLLRFIIASYPHVLSVYIQLHNVILHGYTKVLYSFIGYLCILIDLHKNYAIIQLLIVLESSYKRGICNESYVNDQLLPVHY